jgi:hypothetical protein
MLSVDSGLLSGDREVCAGETPNDSIHAVTIEIAWEGSHVRPDRSRFKAPVFHARRQYAGCADFPFAEHDAASIWNRDSDGEIESACSGEEADVLGR